LPEPEDRGLDHLVGGLAAVPHLTGSRQKGLRSIGCEDHGGLTDPLDAADHHPSARPAGPVDEAARSRATVPDLIEDLVLNEPVVAHHGAVESRHEVRTVIEEVVDINEEASRLLLEDGVDLAKVGLVQPVVCMLDDYAVRGHHDLIRGHLSVSALGIHV